MDKKEIIDSFHKIYCGSGNWQNTSMWMGKRILKCPNDLFVYQEIIFETRPNLIIETGTAYGATTLFLAQMMDLVGIDGRVVSVDVADYPGRPIHPKIKYINGSSTRHGVLKQIKDYVRKYDKVMVILDSDHRKNHVLKELRKYMKWTSQGCYLIVEDTNINGNPVRKDFGPGPHEAIEQYMNEDDTFEIDCSREKHLLTFNPHGYLKKIKPSFSRSWKATTPPAR